MFLMLISCVGVLIGAIALMIYRRLGHLENTLERISDTLHSRVTGLENRVTRIETRCDTFHTGAAK